MLDNLNIPDETKNSIYSDGFQPLTSEAGRLLGRVPRAINAALSSLDIWILQREYNVSSTKKILENKLATIDSDKIVSPAPYVAVPAIQGISYCIDSNILRELYANLLSKSMISDVKEKVHPSFVEIIKQLSPEDSLILKIISESNAPIPAATLSIVLQQQGLCLAGQPPVEKSSLEIIPGFNCTFSRQQVRVSMDNLKRLGLIEFANIELSDTSKYDYIYETEAYKEIQQLYERLKSTDEVPDYIKISKKVFSLSSYGVEFCNICLIDP